MEAKKQSVKQFLKKNFLYLIVAFVLLAAVTVTVILLVGGNDPVINDTLDSNGGEQLENPGSSTPAEPDSGNQQQPEDPSDPGEPDQPDEPSKPTQTVISFIMPVDGATVLCDYTEASLVYNKTLGIYTGHLAIDFGAPDGSAVKAVYAGTVESVETGYLTGTTVTIAHANGIKTVYNSIESAEGLVAGDTVEQGEIIGSVSDNNKQEYKDGPHLHFEVYENGKKISPYKYLTVSEK